VTPKPELPGGVTLLLRALAASSGWRWKVIHARGTPIDAEGEPVRMPRPRVAKAEDQGRAKSGTLPPMPIRVVDSFMVRARHQGGNQLVAVWEDEAYRVGYLALAGLWWTKVDATALRRAVRDTSDSHGIEVRIDVDASGFIEAMEQLRSALDELAASAGDATAAMHGLGEAWGEGEG
jgi:hypothetical protein